MEENIFSKVKSSAASIKEKIGDFKDSFWDEEKEEIIKQFADSGKGKITEMVESINRSSELFNKAGYSLNQIEITLGLPPDLVLEFSKKESISDEEENQLIEETKDNKIVSLIIKSLFKANDFANSLKIGDRKLKSVEITFGITPGISVIMS